eukprot:3940863-Rhodomonas_salina.1
MAGLENELWGESGTTQTKITASTAYYFLNPHTMEIRENYPWVQKQSVAQGAGYICDEMRSMPRLGSAFAETTSATILFMKKIVGLFIGLPALAELYSSPEERCELEAKSMHHSAFDDCGVGYLDMTEVFDAINRANAHMWEVFDTLALVFTSRLEKEISEPLVNLVTGARMYQENQVTLQLTGVVDDFVEMVDSGAEKLVFGGPSGDAIGFGTTMFSMGSPAFMSGMSISVSPVAYAEYAWIVVTRGLDKTIVLGTTATKRGDSSALAAKFVIGNLTNIWYDTLAVEWDDIIVNRGKRMCTGLSMMVGYTNAWGRFLRHWCIAGIEYTNGMLSAGASLAVDIQVTACVCAESIDHDFESFVREVCVARAPETMKVFLLSMLAWHGDVKETGSLDSMSIMQTVCTETLEQFDDTLHAAFNPWADAQLRAAQATISMLDYLGVIMGRESGDCESMQTNPLIAIVIPTPIDYFRVCGQTTACKVKCAAYETALANAIQKDGSSATMAPLHFRTNVENSMFRRYRAGEVEEATIHLLALAELPMTHFDCTCIENSDCVGVIGAGYGTLDATQLYVRTYCIPMGIGERVYMGTEWVISEESTSLKMTELLDEDENDSIMRIAFSVPTGDHILVLLRTFRTILEEEVSVLSGKTDWIVAIRHSTVVPATTIVNSQSIMLECGEALKNALLEDEYDLADDLEREFALQSVTINDFISLNSTEFSVDLVIKVGVSGRVITSSSEDGWKSIVSDNTFTASSVVRIGWCEFLPPQFDGPRRQSPSECMGVWDNKMTCLRPPKEMQKTLFKKWLADGSFLYDPIPDEYLWIPSSVKAAHNSVESNILSVNISMSGGVFEVDTENIKYRLGGGAATKQALGGAYALLNNQRINRLTYTPHPNSLVGHWNPEDATGDDVLGLGKAMWYTAVTKAIARAWLRDARYNFDYRTLSTTSSRKKSIEVAVELNCNRVSCNGCANLQTKQLCTALQTCMTQECIGSKVNYGDLVCNIGHILESGMGTTVAVYIASWHAIVSMLTEVLKTTAFEQDGEYSLRFEWISDIVYTI